MNQKEIENVIALQPIERYKYFIKKVADFAELWTIVDQEGDYFVASIDDKTMISFWTAEEFVTPNLIDELSDCRSYRLTLDDLADSVLDYIVENEHLLNIFPVNARSGFIVDLEEFSVDLNKELKNYE